MRAQTTLDFAVGISVFIIAVSFAVTFVPGMLDPFTTGNQEETVTADRVATQLATVGIAEPDDPYVLHIFCTEEFFRNPGGSQLSNCPMRGTDLRERIGLRDRQPVQIFLKGDDNRDSDFQEETLCWDDSQFVVVEETNRPVCGDEADDVVLAVGGEAPTKSGSVTTARRVVLVNAWDNDESNDIEAKLVVKLWR